MDHIQPHWATSVRSNNDDRAGTGSGAGLHRDPSLSSLPSHDRRPPSRPSKTVPPFRPAYSVAHVDDNDDIRTHEMPLLYAQSDRPPFSGPYDLGGRHPAFYPRHAGPSHGRADWPPSMQPLPSPTHPSQYPRARSPMMADPVTRSPLWPSSMPMPADPSSSSPSDRTLQNHPSSTHTRYAHSPSIDHPRSTDRYTRHSPVMSKASPSIYRQRPDVDIQRRYESTKHPDAKHHGEHRGDAQDTTRMQGALVPFPAQNTIDDGRYEAEEAPPPNFTPLLLVSQEAEPRSYQLRIRQSPKHGQMCTLGNKSRKILDPLPIIQLDVRDRFGKRDTMGFASPFLLMQVKILVDQLDPQESSASSRSYSLGVEHPSAALSSDQRLLEGKLAVSAYMVREASERSSMIGKRSFDEHERDNEGLNDEEQAFGEADGSIDGGDSHAPQNADPKSRPGKRSQNLRRIGQDSAFSPAPSHVRSVPSHASSTDSPPPDSLTSELDEKLCFFIFSDLSIRMCGTYRLQFSLVRLGQSSPVEGSFGGTVVAQCTSKPFPVVHPRHFAGLSESTPLAKALANQGVHIPIRNESRWRASSGASEMRKMEASQSGEHPATGLAGPQRQRAPAEEPPLYRYRD